MIKEVNQACEKLNTTLGLSVTLPTPKKKALKMAAVGNFMASAGLVAAGIIFTSKSCAVLGSISLINGIVLQKESKR